MNPKRGKPFGFTVAAAAGSTLSPPGPSRQISFHQLLVAARKKFFIDALSDALSKLDQQSVKEQAGKYVPADVQKLLASSGLRDEYVFPLPAVITAKPTLVGYYRLLLGAPQKSFYKGATGMGPFKSMEELGTMSKKQEARVSEFCWAMSTPLAELVRQIPNFAERDLHELPLLTFGSQLQGSNNTQIGKKAMQEVFLAITEILKKRVIKKEADRLTLKNSAGRTVMVTLAHDPDVRLQEQVGDRVHNKVAIEVKGGTDVSNAHNRAGEAEKSHLKAKQKGYRDFWTIISKAGLEMSKLTQESQTTTEWFDVTELLARSGRDWEGFRERLAGAAGIPLAGPRRNKRSQHR
ncbi:MAG TPA: XcyI family restriction endonuclease [Candidatus Acidoferrales bacterium]|nr:XcyI family restriction endonuclease [Candidatus Acidoferrales bacterium]